jgi:adenylate kinase family enzyme
MKIAILGYSGSGKSTLAAMLGEYHKEPVFYFDCVHWLPGWVERDRSETGTIVKEFMDSHNGWVMDGTYSRHQFDRRMEEADEIILLLFPRFTCLWRACKRQWRYKGKTRPSITDGCEERLNLEFIWWILYKGRTDKQRTLYASVLRDHKGKCTVIKNQKQLDAYYAQYKKEEQAH